MSGLLDLGFNALTPSVASRFPGSNRTDRDCIVDCIEYVLHAHLVEINFFYILKKSLLKLKLLWAIPLVNILFLPQIKAGEIGQPIVNPPALHVNTKTLVTVMVNTQGLKIKSENIVIERIEADGTKFILGNLQVKGQQGTYIGYWRNTNV